MITAEEFKHLADIHGTLMIDGALATELETRGYSLNHALWSAKILREQPEAIEQVHLDYYLAGADIAITASYQASCEGLQHHFGLSGNDAMSLIGESARLAKWARKEALKHIDTDQTLLVAGSIGPYGAYLADGSEYRGDYDRSIIEFQRFHRPRIQALIDESVDLLAIETMPQLSEIEAVLQLLEEDFPAAICWISCTLRDADHLSDGTSIEDLLSLLHGHRDRVVAVGINCVSTTIVADALRTMSRYTNLPLLCYPNSGELWNADTKTWTGSGVGDNDGEQIQSWRDLGARLVGGCCRTGPDYIKLVRKTLMGE